MPTSGSYSITLSRDQVITQALRKLNVIDDETAPSPTQIASCATELDGLLKIYETLGMALWAIEDVTIPGASLVGGSVLIGPGLGVDLPYVPLRVYNARRTDNTDATNPQDIDLMVLARYDYDTLTNKKSVGTPNQFYYDYQNTFGKLSVYPTPDTSFANNSDITITLQRPFQDAGTDGTYILDFPQYWQLPLIYGLAYNVSPNYGYPVSDRSQLKADWQLYLEMAIDYGYEEGSIFFQPERRW